MSRQSPESGSAQVEPAAAPAASPLPERRLRRSETPAPRSRGRPREARLPGVEAPPVGDEVKTFCPSSGTCPYPGAGPARRNRRPDRGDDAPCCAGGHGADHPPISRRSRAARRAQLGLRVTGATAAHPVVQPPAARSAGADDRARHGRQLLHEVTDLERPDVQPRRAAGSILRCLRPQRHEAAHRRRVADEHGHATARPRRRSSRGQRPRGPLPTFVTALGAAPPRRAVGFSAKILQARSSPGPPTTRRSGPKDTDPPDAEHEPDAADRLIVAARIRHLVFSRNGASGRAPARFASPTGSRERADRGPGDRTSRRSSPASRRALAARLEEETMTRHAASRYGRVAALPWR